MSGSVYRAEYVKALSVLAKASAVVRRSGSVAPVLVGGAVVEFDTSSRIVSGDFDFVSGDDDRFAAALVGLGFEQGDGLSIRKGTFHHPALGIGVEMVSGDYFDGLGDRERIRLVRMAGGAVSMAPTEDLIADRLGQWTGMGRKDPNLLNQAVTLFRLAEELDLFYLDKRVLEETCGDLCLKGFSRLCDEDPDLG